MSLDQIVNVQISRGAQTVTQAGFGTALILGTVGASFGTDKIRAYSSIKSVAADFATTDPVYKAALALFGQENVPPLIKVGKKTTNVAQVTTFQVTAQADGVYSITINGTVYSFTAASQTITQIRTALLALLTAASAAQGVNFVTASTDSITATAAVAGVGFSYATSTGVAAVATTPNNGPVEDISALQVIDDDFYAVMMTSRVAADILALAPYIETQRKVFVYCQADAGMIASTTTDVGSILKAKSISRTFGAYSADQVDFPEAAWLGECLPFDPGSETWKFKTLALITPDDQLSDTQINNLINKNINYYQTTAGVPMMAEGVVASGEFIDVIRFIDWLHARIQETIFQRLVDLPKIPYTDAGVAIIEADLRSVLALGVRVGGLSADPAPDVQVPKVADVPQANRAARLLPDITFTGTLAGAVHSLNITGTVSV